MAGAASTSSSNLPPQVEQMTRTVEAFMNKYPKITLQDKFQSVSEATGYPAAWFFVVAGLLMMGVLTLVGGAKLLVDLLGFVYPAYMSFKSMDTNAGDDTQWLTYWIVFSFLSIVETMLSFLTALIPMYFWLKVAIIIWMWYPSTRGAQTIYDQILRPILIPYIEAANKNSKAE